MDPNELDDDEPQIIQTDDEPLGGEQEGAGNDNGDDAGGEQAEAEEFVIEIEGEEQADETPLVKKLRDEVRERDRRLAAYEKTAAPKIEVGTKPTLESCDYDEERFETEYEAWQARKLAADRQEEDATRAAETRQQEDARRVAAYQAKLAALPLPEAEKVAAQEKVVSELPVVLQAAILRYAADPAKVVVALAKHPHKLAALAQETDPINFVLAMKDMENKMTVVSRRRPPEPEAGSIQRGSASPRTTDKKLEALEKEANRTGDRTKLIAYKKQLSKAA